MDNENKLIEHLKKLWDSQRFPQSIIVRTIGATQKNKNAQRLFAQNFLNHLLMAKGPMSLAVQNEEENCSLSPHPDVLIMAPKKEKYLVADIDLIQSFLEHNPLALNKKIIILEKAQSLGDQGDKTIPNKLLKILESPPIPATFILMVEGGKKLMATIEGRALKFNYFSKDLTHLNSSSSIQSLNLDLKEWAQGKKDLPSIISSLSKNEISDDDIKYFVLNYISDKNLKTCSASDWPRDLLLKKNILSELKIFEKSEAYNNPRASRLASFFNLFLSESSL